MSGIVGGVLGYVKMKTKILFLFFTVVGLIPAYTVLGWITIFNKYPKLSQVNKLQLFNREVFFGFADIQSFFIQGLVILAGICSIFYFIQNPIKNQHLKRLKLVAYIILLSIFSIFTLLNIWFIL